MDSSDSEVVVRTDLREYLPLLAEGKVREIYSIDDSTLLFVATDRISGIPPIPDTGDGLRARWWLVG